jgi:hypothetical protein
MLYVQVLKVPINLSFESRPRNNLKTYSQEGVKKLGKEGGREEGKEGRTNCVCVCV